MNNFSISTIQLIKDHISKNGFPDKKENCKLREEIHVTGKDNKPSRRITWCCKVRTGIALSDWKCVGLDHINCIFNAAR